jgi:aspartate/tyrosine/aromatic aminotransferase
MKKVARTTYSNPPAYGARLICTLLKNAELKALWREELEQLRLRIHARRALFIEEMAKYQDKSALLENHANRNTIFLRTGLASNQVEYLRKKYAFYMNYSGQINVMTIDPQSMPLVCSAICDALNN